jgi:broad specificity phosphatase PhoE
MPRRAPRVRLTAALLPAVLLLALAGAPAAAQEAATTVVLVRHAERAQAAPGDPDPPLSAAGEARARALAEVLADAGVEALVVSERQRTRLTAAPLAEARGLEPEVVPIRDGAEANAAAVAELIRARHAGRTVLVVAHSHTVPAILAALGGPGMIALCDWEYDDLLVVSFAASAASGEPPRTIRARYGAPSVPAETCN